MAAETLARVEPRDPADALSSLLSRISVPPRLLVEPGPSAAEVDTILKAAMRAPDHGNLKPVRFILVRGEARARLGDLFAQATRQREPNAEESLLERVRTWPRTCPLTIALVTRTQPDHKIPVSEQMLSAGASGANILNAMHALGYAGMWVTGANTYDPFVQKALGIAEHEILIGFIGIGTAPAAYDGREPPVREAAASDWTG
jgi:nitroreductase